IWLRDVDRLHTLLATYGEAALRAAFARGLAEQAIGAEYIAHYLADGVTTPPPIEGDSTGRPDARSSCIGHPGESNSRDEPLLLHLPAAQAIPASREGRVQAAGGAPRRGGAAKRSAWTRPSPTLPFDTDGGRS
ncbi:MAG: hypothetical protein ACRET7_11110, partial [Burkholderiales bacterium]